MSATAIRLIRDEHLAIASVLYSLRTLVRQIREQGAEPDFRLLHAMLDYIVVFPERLHHPKEDRHLFPALLARCPEAGATIAELEAEHRRGAQLILELTTTLTAYARQGAEALPAFSRCVEDYSRFHWQHMNKEEEKILPLAQIHLSAEDWSQIADAFRANDNPLFGIKPRDQAELLYQKILALSPGEAAGRMRQA